MAWGGWFADAEILCLRTIHTWGTHSFSQETACYENYVSIWVRQPTPCWQLYPERVELSQQLTSLQQLSVIFSLGLIYKIVTMSINSQHPTATVKRFVHTVCVSSLANVLWHRGCVVCNVSTAHWRIGTFRNGLTMKLLSKVQMRP